MGQQQSLHLPLALITVKIISYRRLQVEAGEWGRLKVRALRPRWWKFVGEVGVGFASEVSVGVIGNEDWGHDSLKGQDPGGLDLFFLNKKSEQYKGMTTRNGMNYSFLCT